MDTIILLVVGVVAVGVLLEARKRRRGNSQSTPEDGQRTAAEVGPTETGKFRVDLMLKKTEHLQVNNKDAKDNDTEDLDEGTTPLPDPFKK